MKSLTPALVATVRAALKGAKLAKFDASIAILNESIAQGGWTSRGAIKSNSGFYQGLVPHMNFQRDYGLKYSKAKGAKQEYADDDSAQDLERCLNFGQAVEPDRCDVERGIPRLRANLERHEEPPIKVSDDVIRAWVALCAEKDEASQALTKARPLPRITTIGLSPKVTMTLKECNLDLDLPSIKMAKIEERFRPAFEWTYKEVACTPTRHNRWKSVEKIPDQYVPAFDKKGKRKLEMYYVVIWTVGIVHNASRFISGCQACGKHIPSGKFVPVEAHDKQSGKLISMWLGCDCAANIFGIKDIGVEQPKAKE